MVGKYRKLLKKGSHQFQARKEKIQHALLALPDNLDEEIFPKTEFLLSTLISNSKKMNEVSRNTKGTWENCILSVPTNNRYCISTNKILELKLPSTLVNTISPEANTLFSKIFSLKTWNSLPKDVQNNLMKFLPNFQKLSEEEQFRENEYTIQQLFSGSNFHFGNPIQTFVKNLTVGRYTKESKNHRNKILEQQFKFACYLKAYNQNMIRRILFFKEQIGIPDNNSYLLFPPLARQYDPSYLLHGADTQGSDTEEDSENEDHELSCYEFDLKEQIQQLQIKKEELLKLENDNSQEYRETTNNNELQSPPPSFKSPGSFQRPAPAPITPIQPAPPKRNLAKRKKSAESTPDSTEPPKKKMKPSNTKSRSTPKPIVYDESYPSPPEHPGPVWMFFPTLREIFIQNDNKELDLQTIITEFKKDKERVSLIYSTYTLENFIFIGLLFLEKPPNVSSSAPPSKEKVEAPEPRSSKKSKSQKSRSSKSNETPKATQTENNSTPSTSPASIPTILNSQGGGEQINETPYEVGGAYVRCNPATQKWKWVGDLDEEFLEELDTLELLFYFSITRKVVSPDQNLLNLIPIKQQKCSTTIVPSTAEEVEAFQEQERNRYLSPEKPFTYVFRNSQVCVAPMKRGLGNQKQKPRDHFLLKKDRPPHISLLCLVRDAAARLPGGIGTRPDVAILLRDSQYIVNDVAEVQLNTVVSGALDRLHAEVDPCVRFDAEQKLWIYLHRRRKESNFAIFKPKRRGKK